MGLNLKLIISRVLILVMTSILLTGCTLFDKEGKAGIQVITGDTNSSIFLNGQYLEKTPLNEKNILPGQYTLEIRPDNPDLVPYQLQVTLREGLLTVVTWKPGFTAETSGGVVYEMEPLKNKKDTEVSFVTIPDYAIITLDGVRKEFSPATLTDLEPGQTEFEVVLPSYETQKHTINVVEGYRMLINVRLAKLNNYSNEPIETVPESKDDDPIEASESASRSGPVVKILPTNFIVNGAEVLRVRDAASPAGRELGFAKVGESYPYLDVSNGWHQIEFEGKEGWVSTEFSQLIE